MLKDCVHKYYLEQNYNCAESLLRGANDHFGLALGDREMILAGVFGAGIQTGNTCGAFLAAAMVVSMKYVAAKAHESADIKPAAALLTEKFSARMGSLLCSEVKPRFFVPGVRCLAVVDAACEALEETLAEYQPAEA